MWMLLVFGSSRSLRVQMLSLCQSVSPSVPIMLYSSSKGFLSIPKRSQEFLSTKESTKESFRINKIPNLGHCQKTTSYSLTLSLKVGGGQDEIILLGAAKIVTTW